MKGTLALIVALAAVVLFAPVARADVYDATHPYRTAVDPTPDGTPIGTADNKHGEKENGHECEAGDKDEPDEHEEDEGGEGDDAEDKDVAAMGVSPSNGEADHDQDDQCPGSGNPPKGGDKNTPPEQGPTTSAAPGVGGYWLWILLVGLAAIAGGTAVVLRRRMTRNR